MNCILHIGTEKTGTTTLQHFLHANSDDFLNKGFGVLNSVGVGNNRRLASYAMSDDRLNDDYFLANEIDSVAKKITHDKVTEKLLSEEVEALKIKQCHTVLITSEHFHSRCVLDSEVNKLKNLLLKHFDNVKVLCYLRPQIDVAISLYTTVLRSGAKVEFDEFLSRNCTPQNQYYDYSDLLDRWSNAFGLDNLVTCIFDTKKLASGDVVKDYLKNIGISNLDDFKFFKKTNESLTVFGQEALRLNNIHSYDFAFKGLPFKKYIYKNVNNSFVGKGNNPESSRAKEIQEKFEDINNLVAQKYFNGKELFQIDFEKYKEEKLDIAQKEFLKTLFEAQSAMKLELSKDQDFNKPFKQIVNNLTANTSSADILREVALAFEKSGDIPTAQKVMHQAHLLRPSGSFIKQKLDEYTEKLQNKPHEGATQPIGAPRII